MWEHTVVTLACGCEGTGSWNEDWPGDAQECARHGGTTIQRISRIYEARHKKFQLGLAPEEVEVG